MGQFNVQYRDYGTPGETSTVQIPIVDLTDTNIVAITAQLDTLRLAMDAITLGGLESRSLQAWVNNTKSAPESAFAQREMKWLVRYHEDVAAETPHTMQIPCADLALLDPNANDKALMTDPAIVAFVNAFEAVVKVNTNAVVVDSIEFLGVRS